MIDLFFCLHAPLFRWSATVVGQGRDVLDTLDVHAGSLQGRNGTFATTAWTTNSHFELLDAKLGRLFGRLLGSALSGKRSSLSASLKATRTATGPAQRIALGVGDGDGCVVKARRNKGNP